MRYNVAIEALSLLPHVIGAVALMFMASNLPEI